MNRYFSFSHCYFWNAVCKCWTHINQRVECGVNSQQRYIKCTISFQLLKYRQKILLNSYLYYSHSILRFIISMTQNHFYMKQAKKCLQLQSGLSWTFMDIMDYHCMDKIRRWSQRISAATFDHVFHWNMSVFTNFVTPVLALSQSSLTRLSIWSRTVWVYIDYYSSFLLL